MDNRIFLVVGPPAVGKSTTSHALAAHFPKSIHIPVDDLRTMVVSGLLLPSAEWSDALAEQVALARASATDMAFHYYAAGFTVVMDDFWDADHLADFARLSAHPALYKVILYPEQEAAHARNLRRSGDSPARAYIDEGIRIVYQRLQADIARLAEDGWLVVNSSALNIEDVVATIIEQTSSHPTTH